MRTSLPSPRNHPDVRRTVPALGIAFAMLVALLPVAWAGTARAAEVERIAVDPTSPGRVFDGVGAVSAGASSRLLYDYPEPERSQVLDYLFKPGYGAAMQTLKVEIGGDSNSTDGSEASHRRSRGEVDCTRGYEWWLMHEAKKRNPDIKLAALAWGVPGWIEGGFWSKDTIDYLVSWLGCAKEQGLTIDNIGGWNERGYEKEWYKDLHAALARNDIETRIVAADSFDWKIAEDLRDDAEFAEAVDVVGMHFVCGHRTLYQECGSTRTARKLGKPLWMSENSALAHDVGGGPISRALNRMYIDAKVTSYASWSLVSAWYANLPIADTGVMLAEWPWSGHYKVADSVWAYAHTTQFSAPGWKYVNSAMGRLDSGATYVTRRSPDAEQASMVIESLDADAPSEVAVEMKGSLAGKPVHVWASDMRSADGRDHFVHAGTVRPRDGSVRLTVEPGHVYTLTTVDSGGKGDAAPRAGVHERMRLPYVEDFSGVQPGDSARYLSDVNGAFEAAPCTGGRNGMCYEQMATQKPIAWGGVGANMDPTTLVGDPRWTGDYEVSTKVRLRPDSYAEVVGRVSLQPAWTTKVSGYHLRVAADGAWRLYSDDLHDSVTDLASGRSEVRAGSWHSVGLRMKGKKIAVVVDGEVLAKVRDGRQTTGNVALRVKAWDSAQFDDLSVQPTAPQPAFVPKQQMSAAATSEHGFYAGWTYEAANAVDDRPESMWHTRFGADKPPLPQALTVDLGRQSKVSEVWIQPRYGNTPNGMITRYQLAVSDNGEHYTDVAKGTWRVSNATKKVRLPDRIRTRYVRLTAIEAVNANAAIGELEVMR